MAYTASVNLGPTIGIGITSVKLYECTGNNSGCTALTNYSNVPITSFNPTYTVTGITDSKRWLKVEPVGACSGTTQNLQVSGFPDPTATPAPTATAGPSATATATPTPSPSPTPGPTSTSTPTPTASSTPTPTPTALPGCGDTIIGSYAPSGYTLQTHLLDLSEATNGDTITITYTANDRPNRFNIYGGGFLVVSSLWAGSDPDMGTTYTGPWTGNPIDSDGSGSISFTYQTGITYELKVDVGGANPNASPTPNPSDAWSVTISCSSPTPVDPIGFTATPSCVGYAPTGVTITIGNVTGGTGSGYYVVMTSGGDTTPHNLPYAYTGLNNYVGNTYAFTVYDSDDNASGNLALTEDFSCAAAPNNTVSGNLVIQSTQPTSSQCSSGTSYTFDLGSPSATFCNATTFTASGLTGLGTGNNYWICYNGETRQMFHPSNAGYFQTAGGCQTVVV